ncbi:MAG: helix-turn-helix transcriptional regulator [Alphaproteobacteria bacterium]|nr:helix-turn-helix transcriptional regulator [Alphaproteobacteria bacterium]
MTARRQATRRRLLETAYRLFYRKGFARVGIDRIAAEAGVTKRTLYDHFRSKDDLLAAVLDMQRELAAARIRRWTTALDGSAEALIDRLFAELAVWAARPRWEGSGFTRIVLELADLPGHPARSVARRHKAAIEDWIADSLRQRGIIDADEQARHIAILLEGCLVLLLVHGRSDYAKTGARAAKAGLASARKSMASEAARPNHSRIRSP